MGNVPFHSQLRGNSTAFPVPSLLRCRPVLWARCTEPRSDLVKGILHDLEKWRWRGEEDQEEVLFLKRVASLIAPPPTSLSSPLKPRVHLCTARWKTQSGRRRKEGEKNNHRSPLKPQVRPRPRSVVRPAIFDSVTGHGDGHACHDSRWR